MGQDNGKRKSIFIPFNQKLDEEISERISVVQSKKSSIKYKKFLNKKFNKNIEPSNFSHKFNENDSGLNHITDLLNVIYSKNINNNLDNLSGKTFYESIFQYDIIDNDNHDENLINQNMINDMQNLINSENNFENDNQLSDNDSNDYKNPFEVKQKSNKESINNDNNSYINNEISIPNNQNIILNDDNNKTKHPSEILKKKKTEIHSSLNINDNHNIEKKEEIKEKIKTNKKTKLRNTNSPRLKQNDFKKTGPIVNNNITSISPKKKIINSERVKNPIIKKEKKVKSRTPIKKKNKPLITINLDISQDIIKSSKYTNNYPKNKKDFEKMDNKLNEEIKIITNPATNINGNQYREVLNNENFLNVIDTLTQPNKQKKDLIQSFNYKPGINNISKGRNKNNNRDKTPKKYSDLIYKKYK